MIGSCMERSLYPPKSYNTLAAIDDKGHLGAVYRKTHLFVLQGSEGGPDVDESCQFIKGSEGAIFKKGEWRIGLSICFDLRFSEMYQSYQNQGCQVMLVPAVFLKETGQSHWEVLLRARAIENLSFVIGVNQVGVDSRGVEAYGHSMVVGPWGDILARASGKEEEIVYAHLNMDEVHRSRAKLPL